MQSLISQINIQGQGSNTITTVANKNSVVMTTGNAASIGVTGKCPCFDLLLVLCTCMYRVLSLESRLGGVNGTVHNYGSQSDNMVQNEV